MTEGSRRGHPIVQLTLTRLREFLREPEALFWAFVFPIIISLALAIAFPARMAQPVPVAVTDGDGAEMLRAALRAAPGVMLRDVPPGAEPRALRDGEVHLVVIPTVPPTYRFDAAREESRVAQLVVDDALKRAAGRIDPWTARHDPVDLPGSRYIDWLIPGLIGMGLMSNGLWNVSWGIVQMRTRKLLKRMMAAGMRKRDYLLAQICARLLFLLPEVLVPLLFGMVAFGMPVRGSAIALAVVSLLGAMTFGAIGLLLGSRVKTFEAISGLMNVATLPMWILSGVFFSARNFPDALQPFIQALPLTALVDSLRAVVLEGASLAALSGELALLAAWGLIPFGVALRIFRWR